MNNSDFDQASKQSMIDNYHIVSLMANEQNENHPLFQDEVAVKILDFLERTEIDFKSLLNNNNRWLMSVTPLMAPVRHWWADNVVRSFLKENKDGIVVEFGGGLDSRYNRVTENGTVFQDSQWLMIDLPNVVEFREKIYHNLDIATSNNFRAKSSSVNDIQKWTGFVDELRTNNNSVIFTDLACFIYCQPEEVKLILKTISEKYSKSRLISNTFHRKLTSVDKTNPSRKLINFELWTWLVNNNFKEIFVDYLDSRISFYGCFDVIEKCNELRKLRLSDEDYQSWKNKASKIFTGLQNVENVYNPELVNSGYNMNLIVFK